MTAGTADVGAIRRQVRATQHARSYPLLAIGALLINYGTNDFAPKPLEWRYGAPLAFVIVWALAKLNERQTGVGIGRPDYLVAAGFVFAGSLLTLSYPFNAHFVHEYQVEGVWVVLVGVALLAMGLVPRDVIMIGAGGLVVLTGVALVGLGHRYYEQVYGKTELGFHQSWMGEWTAIVGAALAVVGVGYYLFERYTA